MSQEARFSALSPVPIGGMMVPRVARVTIQGTNPSLPATECLGVVRGTGRDLDVYERDKETLAL